MMIRLGRFTSRYTSATPDLPLDRLLELGGIVAEPAAERRLDVANVAGCADRVSGEDHQIRLHAWCNRPDPLVEAENLRAVRRHDLNRLLGREPRLDEELVVPLVAVPGDRAQTA